MTRACIAIADASRARLFTFERTSEPEGIHEDLVEEKDLVNPARRLRAVELFSESRPGTSRTGGLQYTLDDHRDAHVAALDAEFARQVAAELATLLRVKPAARLILCASPRMLGALRDETHDLHDGTLQVDEVPRDLVKLTPPKLRDQLAAYGLLPPRAARARRV